MTASTVAQYLAALPADRRAALSAVRKVINENLPDGYEEGMQFGMIGWCVPLSLYPAGYGENPKVPLSFVALASQSRAWCCISSASTVIPLSEIGSSVNGATGRNGIDGKAARVAVSGVGRGAKHTSRSQRQLP